MNKHTPGPWQLARFNPDRATVEVETVERGDDLPDQGCFIALVGAYGATAEESADARLIAAAPDLLAALETLTASLDWEEKRSGTTYHGIDSARAAIAKARGD